MTRTRAEVKRKFSFENSIPNGPWYTLDVNAMADHIVAIEARIAQLEAELQTIASVIEDS